MTQPKDDAYWRAYYAAKDAEFERLKEQGEFPSCSCESCSRRGGCCKYWGHHIGDVCLHCGNDERHIQPIKEGV